MHYGPIPIGMFVLHRCDNPPCVRPDHLWLGTPLDNMRDMIAKGRQRWTGSRQDGERNNHAKLTEADVRIIREMRGRGMSQRDVAARFGIGRVTVSLIENRKRWAHV